MKIKHTFGILLALSTNAVFANDSQVSDPRKLQVSSNNHYIEQQDKTPFLWIGDTPWGMAQQLKREDIDEYLDDRQKLGFTVIQVVAYWYPHGGGLAMGPNNAANAYGFRPFTGDENSPDIRKPLVVKGGSPDAPNDYWDHLDYIVAAVKKRNMHLALLPCWGRAYITSQMNSNEPVFDETSARSFGVFLGNRYSKEKHIIWTLGGDAKAQIQGYDKRGTYRDFDKRPVFRAMAEGLGNGVTGKKLAWNKPDPAWDDIFMTYHPDGDVPDNSSKWFHNDAWLDVNGVEIWKEVDFVYSAMLNDYQLKNPTKPSLFLEGSYEYGTYGHECGWVTPVMVRRQFYQTFFAGGAGHTYGAGPIWAMRGQSGDYNCGYTWKQALDFPGAQQITGFGKTFLLTQKWAEWTPDARFIKGRYGEGPSLKVSIITAEGSKGLIYYANNSAAEIKNALKGKASLTWFDPRSGKYIESGTMEKDETRSLIPPEGLEDAVLILKLNE